MFWNENWMVKTPSFWMTGFGGQRIGVDLRSGRTMVQISNAEDFMPAVYRIFDKWTRQCVNTATMSKLIHQSERSKIANSEFLAVMNSTRIV